METQQLNLNFENSKLDVNRLPKTVEANVIDLQAHRSKLEKDHQDELIASILDSIRHLKQK